MAPVLFVCISICSEYVMYVCQSNFALITVGVSCLDTTH